ncbi:DNA helicase PIF1, ATP-dependent [Tanacetum coccineum]
MIKDAETFKLEDQELKNRAYAYNALQDHLYDTENMIDDNKIKKRVHTRILKKFENAVADTTEWLHDNDDASVNNLKSKQARLESFWKPLIQDRKTFPVIMQQMQTSQNAITSSSLSLEPLGRAWLTAFQTSYNQSITLFLGFYCHLSYSPYHISDPVMHLKRVDGQLYKFKEGDFVDLHLNDIEDTLLLAVQHKLFHLNDSDIVDFIMALHGTLKIVRNELHHRILDFHLGYNKEMSRRKWTAIDKRRSELMVELIDKQMRERRIIRNLKRLVGARELEMDYRLMTHTPKPLLFLDQLEVDGTGTIVVMIGRVRDVNAVTGRYLSTEFFVSDSKVRGQVHEDGSKTLGVFTWKLEGELGDVLVEKKTKHAGVYAMVLTGMSGKEYNNKSFYKHFLNGLFYDDDDNLCLVKGIKEQRQVLKRVDGIYPSLWYEKCRKGATRKLRKWVCEACNKAIDYHVFSNGKLLKYSVESLMGTEDEYSDADNELNLPVAIRNLIGTKHVLEIKSHTYYEYGSFESFNDWKINPNPSAEDGAFSSTPAVTANDVELSIGNNLTPQPENEPIFHRHPAKFCPTHLRKAKKEPRKWHSSLQGLVQQHTVRQTSVCDYISNGKQPDSTMPLTVSEVAAIIINDFGDAHPTRDIVVDRKDTRPQRVSELHPSYMALQYPLLFSYGEEDAMALCQAYENLDLFITFTSNPKWPEILEMLAYFPG